MAAGYLSEEVARTLLSGDIVSDCYGTEYSVKGGSETGDSGLYLRLVGRGTSSDGVLTSHRRLKLVRRCDA